jgi:putative ABC transport system ATP-binding protein
LAPGDRFVRLGIVTPTPLLPKPRSAPAVAAALEAHELYRFYHAGDDEVMALRGVSLRVASGEFVAVVGPSGSGKSTLLACLAGLDDPDGGTVRVAGQVMSRRPERQRATLRANGIGVVLQSSNLVEHLSVAANLRLAYRLGGRHGGRPGNSVSESGSRGRSRLDIEALLTRVGLAHRASAYPSQLSGGEAVRAGLAVALVNGPAAVVADEPTAEVDQATEIQLLELLHGEVARGLALVVASHSPAVAEAADRVVTLADGRVVG